METLKFPFTGLNTADVQFEVPARQFVVFIGGANPKSFDLIRQIKYRISGYDGTTIWDIERVNSNRPKNSNPESIYGLIENNLHPQRQRTLLSDLKSKFPHTQFILTTNSPLVLGSIPSDELAVVKVSVGEDGRPVFEVLDLPFDQMNVNCIYDAVWDISSTPFANKEPRLMDWANSKADHDALLKAFADEENDGWIVIKDGCELPEIDKHLWLTIWQQAEKFKLEFVVNGYKIDSQGKREIKDEWFCTPDMFAIRRLDIEHELPYQIVAWRYAEQKPQPFTPKPE